MADENTTDSTVVLRARDETAPVLQQLVANVKNANDQISQILSKGYSTQLKTIADQTKAVGDASDKHVAHGAKNSFDNASDAAKGFIQSLTSIPLGYAAAGAAAEEFARRSFLGFAEIQRTMEQIQFTTGANADQMKQLGAQFSELATRSGKSVQELQEDFKNLAAVSGLSGDQASAALGKIVDMTSITGASVDDLSKIYGAAVNNMKLSGADLDQFMANIGTHMPTKILQEFSDVFPRLSAQMDTLGFHGREAGLVLSSSFEAMARALGNPRLAAASLNDIMAKMGDTSTQLGQRMLPIMEQLFQSGDKSPSLHAMGSMLSMMNQFGAFLDDPLFKQNAEHMFGLDAEQLRALQVEWNAWPKIIQQVNAEMHDGKKEADAMADAIKNVTGKDAQSSIDELVASFKDLSNSVGEALASMGTTEGLKEIAAQFRLLADSIHLVIDGLKWLQQHGPLKSVSGAPKAGSVASAASTLAEVAINPATGVFGYMSSMAHIGSIVHNARNWMEGTGDYAKNNQQIPGKAAGGIIRKRPGGTVVRVGEGGSDEAIVPLNGAGGGDANDEETRAVKQNTEQLSELNHLLWDMVHGVDKASGGGGGFFSSLYNKYFGGGAGGGGGGGGAPGGVILPGGGLAPGPAASPEGVVPKAGGKPGVGVTPSGKWHDPGSAGKPSTDDGGGGTTRQWNIPKSIPYGATGGGMLADELAKAGVKLPPAIEGKLRKGQMPTQAELESLPQGDLDKANAIFQQHGQPPLYTDVPKSGAAAGGGGGSPFAPGGPFGPTTARGEPFLPPSARPTGGAGATGMTPTPTGGGKQQRVAGTVVDELRKAGLPDTAIQGVLANLRSETPFDASNRHRDQPRYAGTEAEYAHGVFQLGGGQWNDYKSWLDKNHPGADWKDPALQTQFQAHELQTKSPGVWSALKNARSPEDAAHTFLNYLAPAKQYHDQRANQYSHGVPPISAYTGAATTGTSSGSAAGATSGTAATQSDDLGYVHSFGGHSTGRDAPGENPELVARMAAAGRAYQQETGKNPHYGEMDRDNATQAGYYARYRAGTGGIAAPPGRSAHNKGLATDVPGGPFRDWLYQKGHRFGLTFPLGRRDPPHMQMDPRYKGPAFRQAHKAASGGSVHTDSATEPSVDALMAHRAGMVPTAESPDILTGKADRESASFDDRFGSFSASGRQDVSKNQWGQPVEDPNSFNRRFGTFSSSGRQDVAKHQWGQPERTPRNRVDEGFGALPSTTPADRVNQGFSALHPEHQSMKNSYDALRKHVESNPINMKYAAPAAPLHQVANMRRSAAMNNRQTTAKNQMAVVNQSAEADVGMSGFNYA